MNRKPPPADADIKDLAKRLKALWASGQSVRPFLRQHAALFRELQSQGWSWAGLALALNKARITYRTGKPWTSDSLVQAYSRAQVSQKPHETVALTNPHKLDKFPTNTINGADEKQFPARAAEPMPAIAAMSSPADADSQPEPMQQIFGEAEDEPEPEFKLARFIDWDERRRVAERVTEMGQQSDASTASTSAQPHSQHYLEVMEYLTGKKPPF